MPSTLPTSLSCKTVAGPSLPRESFSLAPFEKYMLADDTRLYSMTCHQRFWFKGRLDYDCFTAALTEALERHPFLHAVLQARAGTFGRTEWTLDTVPVNLEQTLDWQEESVPLAIQPQVRPDLRMRCFVRLGEDSSLLLLQYHHCIADGVGIFSFMDDFFLAYAKAVNAVAMPAALQLLKFAPVEPQLLQRRLNMGLDRVAWLKRTAWDVQRTAKFMACNPRPLAPIRPFPATEPSQLTAAERVVVSSKTLETLQSKARLLKCSLNDVLTAHLFRTLHSWNQHQTGSGSTGKVRISIPMSLRSEIESAMPAANFVSMVFLDRTAAESVDYPALVESVTAEMNLIKKRRIGLTLIRVMALLTKFEVLLRLFLKLPRCMATMVLTNLGRPFAESPLIGVDGLVRAGNVILTDLDTWAPVRSKTHGSLSVNGYGGRLSLTLRYDSRWFSAADALSFLNSYVIELAGDEFLSD
jgi:NRPS condensation-like uncharacterized protein